MNSLKDIDALVDTFKVTDEQYRGVPEGKRYVGQIRIIIDGWGYPVAAVADFGTSWGDRIVVCELIDLTERHSTDMIPVVERLRRRLAIELLFYVKELETPPAERSGPFVIHTGLKGDSI